MPRLSLTFFFTRLACSRSVGDINVAPAGSWIGASSSRGRFTIAAIYAARGQAFAVHGLLQNTRDLLRESAMLGCGAPTQRLFQVVGHIGANKNSLTIRHLSRPLFQRF